MKNVQLEEECIKNLRFQALVVKEISIKERLLFCSGQ